jgi:hypothetical protein
MKNRIDYLYEQILSLVENIEESAALGYSAEYIEVLEESMRWYAEKFDALNLLASEKLLPATEQWILQLEMTYAA